MLDSPDLYNIRVRQTSRANIRHTLCTMFILIMSVVYWVWQITTKTIVWMGDRLTLFCKSDMMKKIKPNLTFVKIFFSFGNRNYLRYLKKMFFF